MPTATDNLYLVESAVARTQIVRANPPVPWAPITCDEANLTCDTLWITCDGGYPIQRAQARAVIGLAGLESS
jgi:hypothetical protein